MARRQLTTPKPTKRIGSNELASGHHRGSSLSSRSSHSGGPSRWQHDGEHALEVQRRRAAIETLWIAGVRPAQIARQLSEQNSGFGHVSCSTVKYDIDAIRAEMQAERVTTLGQRVTEAVERLMMIISEAMTAYHQSRESKDKAALLKIVIEAQVEINKLEGTDAPERVNAAAIAEAWQVMMDVAGEVFGPEMQQYYLARLQGRVSGSMSGLTLGIAPAELSVDADDAEAEAEVEDGGEPESDDATFDDADAMDMDPEMAQTPTQAQTGDDLEADEDSPYTDIEGESEGSASGEPDEDEY